MGLGDAVSSGYDGYDNPWFYEPNKGAVVWLNLKSRGYYAGGGVELGNCNLPNVRGGPLPHG